MNAHGLSDAFVLPGGLLRGGALAGVAAFAPITGTVEQRLREIGRRHWSTPRKVTAVLSEVVRVAYSEDELDRDEAHALQTRLDAAGARALCIGDRQFLMLQLARRLDGNLTWLHPMCEGCSCTFDVPVSRAELPVKVAGPGFPLAEIALAGDVLRIRVPNGGDQERIAGLPLAAARQELLAACFVASSRGAGAELLARLDEAVVGAIETAIDEVAPDVGTRLDVTCPECGRAQELRFDPYVTGLGKSDALFSEVNALALHYHWSEADILALPVERRHLYLRLVEQSLGMHS